MQRFRVSSKDRTSGSTSDFKIKLDKPIGPVSKLYIESINIPHSWYVSMSGINDTLWIKEGVTTYTITMTSGQNFTAAAYATELQVKLRAAYTPDNLHTVTFDSDTLKFTIAHPSTVFSVQFETGGGSITGSMASTIGFNESDTADALSHEAPNIYNLIYTGMIVINSSKLGEADFRTPIGSADTVFVLRVGGSFGDIIQYENQGSHYFISKSNEMFKEIDIQLVFDDYENVIPLNGADITFIFSYE